MAKFLAYKRSDRQVVTVDTVTPTVSSVGNTITGADVSNAFPNRTENIVTLFRGDPYFLYRTTTNEIHLSKYDYSLNTWSDVPGFTAITTASGILTPTALQVVRDRLVAIATLSLSAGADAVIARRSAQDDGTTWSSVVTKVFVTQPLDTRAGPNIVWHSVVWFTTSEGIGYYDPASNTIASTLDKGDDLGIVGQKVNFGSFTFFANDLYYVLPTDIPGGAPELYKLDRTWSVSSPVPVFINQIIVIPGTGAITINNDTGNYSLFVNAADVMSLLYSGGNGSKLVTIARSGTSYTVTDLSATLLPIQFRNEPNLGFSYYVDDRRRTNEKHIVIIRFRPSIPVSVIIARWDGITEIEQVATLDDNGSGLDLIVPDEERSDFRTFTNNQPSVFVDDFSQPFPGRVRIDYTIRDQNARPIDITPEYSIDGQSWSVMTEGDGDSGIASLPSSAIGISYFFFWDAFADLDGDQNVDIRIVARISGV